MGAASYLRLPARPVVVAGSYDLEVVPQLAPKDPAGVAAYEIDLTDRLGYGEAITSLAVAVLTRGRVYLAASSFEGALALITLAGGAPGEVATVRLTVATSRGQVLVSAVTLAVLSATGPVIMALPDPTLLTANGVALTVGGIALRVLRVAPTVTANGVPLTANLVPLTAGAP